MIGEQHVAFSISSIIASSSSRNALPSWCRTTPFTATRGTSRAIVAPLVLLTSFVLERWLPQQDQFRLGPALFKNPNEVVPKSGCFIPLPVGPFNCIGNNPAWMEMRMLVCLVMKSFEMKLTERGGYFGLLRDEQSLRVARGVDA